jgi:predicted transcriptional regulator
MTITIDLSPETERKILERAARSGQDVTAYIHRLIERDIQGVDEALAPFRRQVDESGMSDDELGAFFEGVREEVWQERHGRPSQSS